MSVITTSELTEQQYFDHYTKQLGFKLCRFELGTKGPGGEEAKGWHRRPITRPAAQMGVIHGLSGTAAFDIDHELTFKVFEAIGLNLQQILGHAPHRIVREGGTPKPIWLRPDGVTLNLRQLKFGTHPNVYTVFELRSQPPDRAAQDCLPPTIHPDGYPYRWDTMPMSRDEMEVVPDEILEIWLNWAQYLPLMLSADPDGGHEKMRTSYTLAGSNNGIYPGHDEVRKRFNADHAFDELLIAHDYEQHGNTFKRPGSENGPGIKIYDFGLISYHGGCPLSGTGGNGKHICHDPFSVWATLEHSGDWKKAYAEAFKLYPDVAEKTQSKKKNRRITSEDYIKKLAGMGYIFRMNATNDRLEVNGQPMTDPIRAEIRAKMRDAGYKQHLAAIEDAYLAYAHAHQYHPIKDWLDSLKWDGQPQIDVLASYFRDTDCIFPVWLKRWLIGCVAKIYEQDQNPMLVIDGSQDIGKSFFAAWLGSGQSDLFVEGPLNPDNKDHVLRMITHFVWEVGELGSTMRRADREALKFVLTQKTVTERRPYGRYDITKPVVCNFIGTINNEAGFLTDTSGNRRFLTCELTSIDWGYTQVDVNQVWAEAFHLYRDGEPWRLLPDEMKKQREINYRYRVEPYVMGLFFKYYDLNTGDFDTWMSTTDIIQTLKDCGLRGTDRGNQMELSAGLKELGATKRKISNQQGFFGVTRKSV